MRTKLAIPTAANGWLSWTEISIKTAYAILETCGIPDES